MTNIFGSLKKIFDSIAANGRAAATTGNLKLYDAFVFRIKYNKKIIAYIYRNFTLIQPKLFIF
jgi:hypothetical protein